MNEILADLTVYNPAAPERRIEKVGLIDTGSRFPVLPIEWKERLGPFQATRVEYLQTADSRSVRGEICGPLMMAIDGFEPVSTEAIFLPLRGEEGRDFPIIGHLVLQQAGVVVDMVSHRLFKRPPRRGDPVEPAPGHEDSPPAGKDM